MKRIVTQSRLILVLNLGLHHLSLYTRRKTVLRMFMLSPCIHLSLSSCMAMLFFTQQGLEKCNDVTTKQYQHSTNHHGLSALKQILEKRNQIEIRIRT